MDQERSNMVAEQVQPLEARDLIRDAVALDVRQAYEYDAGHIEGSLHIPIGEIKDRWEELDERRAIVVVCQIGQRSDLVAAFLRDRGYEAVNLVGGLAAWAAEGLPLTTGSATGTVVDGFARGIDGKRLSTR